jgi:hypothetical protein
MESTFASVTDQLPLSDFSNFLDIKYERAYLVGGQPRKFKNIFKTILGQESMRFVQPGIG